MWRLTERDPMDFVLWKPSSDDLPGWDSPWGRGRPGWHIECSAMAKTHLGEIFDIHGGGIDLTFPHHENEIAQSRCALGHDVMARTWMHNGYLQVEGEKMSKSLGNFLTINELLAKWPGEVLRLQMLMTHYRQPLDWTEARCREAQGLLDRWYGLVDGVEAGEVPEQVLASALRRSQHARRPSPRCTGWLTIRHRHQTCALRENCSACSSSRLRNGPPGARPAWNLTKPGSRT